MRTLVHTGLHHTQGPTAHPPPTIAGNGLSSLFLRARVPAPPWGNPCILSARYLMLGDSRHAFPRSWMWAVEHRGIYRFSGNACRKPPGAWLESFAVRAAKRLSLSMLPEQRRDSSTQSGSSSRLSNLHPSVKAAFHPLAGISYSSVSYNRSQHHEHIACLSLWEIIQSWWTYRVPCSLPTAEDSTRPWIGRGEIHTFVSHCFLRSMSKYYFVWVSHFLWAPSDIWCASEFCLALSTQCDRQGS